MDMHNNNSPNQYDNNSEFQQKIRFYYLAEQPTWLTHIANWNHQQWGYLRPDTTLDTSITLFKQRLNIDQLPLTCIAALAEQPIAMFSLIKNNFDFFSDQTIPVLNNVYVDPEYRGHALLAQLIVKADALAANLGFHQLCGFTIDQPLNRLYEKLGCELVGESDYLSRPIWLFTRKISF